MLAADMNPASGVTTMASGPCGVCTFTCMRVRKYDGDLHGSRRSAFGVFFS